MNKELKRCPFCGGEAVEEVRRFGLEKIDRYGAGCPRCCVWFGWYEDEDEAIERWNRRATDAIDRCD